MTFEQLGIGFTDRGPTCCPRVVQTCKYLGFALESCEALWIISEVIRQKLQSNLTMQLGI